jgi:hypothetical protein
MFTKLWEWLKNPFAYRQRKLEEKKEAERLATRLEELRKKDPFIYE